MIAFVLSSLILLYGINEYNKNNEQIENITKFKETENIGNINDSKNIKGSIKAFWCFFSFLAMGSI